MIGQLTAHNWQKFKKVHSLHVPAVKSRSFNYTIAILVLSM